MIAFFELYVSSFWAWAGITVGLVYAGVVLAGIAETVARGRK